MTTDKPAMTMRQIREGLGHTVLPEVFVRATRYAVSLVPEDVDPGGVYEITVEYRGDDRWAVLRLGLCLNSDEKWDRERDSFECEDEWLAAHRFDLETAKRLAGEQATDIAPAKWRGPNTAPA